MYTLPCLRRRPPGPAAKAIPVLFKSERAPLLFKFQSTAFGLLYYAANFLYAHNLRFLLSKK